MVDEDNGILAATKWPAGSCPLPTVAATAPAMVRMVPAALEIRKDIYAV